MDRGHWCWSWDRCYRWSGHKGCKDRNKQLGEWKEGTQDSGLVRSERRDCEGFLFFPVRGVKGYSLLSLAASWFPGKGTWEAAQIG